MTDEEGREVPFQLIRGEATNGDWDLYETEFIAEVPAYGYRLYRTFTNKQASSYPSVAVTENSLENSKIRVEFNSESGEIDKIIYKESGRVATGSFGAVLTDETACDTWAHDKFDLGEVCDRFERPEFQILESGAVCGALRVKTYTGDCTLVRDYKLYSDSDEIRVDLEADFRAKNKALKLCFPAKNSVVCEIPYGTIERELCKGEEPFGKWFASAGVGVANIGKYGYDSTEDSVRMTVLRGAIFADHFGIRDGRYVYMEQGIRRTTYTIFPYTTRTDAHRRAALLNFPARVANVSFHHGTLDERYEGISGDLDNITVSAIKKNEDSDSFVLRAFESEGETAQNKITLFDKTVDLTVTPYAISTVDENGNILNLVEWEK